MLECSADNPTSERSLDLHDLLERPRHKPQAEAQVLLHIGTWERPLYETRLSGRAALPLCGPRPLARFASGRPAMRPAHPVTV